MAEKDDPLGGLPDPMRAQQMFSDPAFLGQMAKIAADARDPAAFKWLERAHVAAKEGAFEAVGHLMAGNPQEAINLWNKTGQYRDVVNVNQNQDGTYSINRQNGQTVTLDPIKEYKRMLSPREFASYEQNEREGKERTQRYKLEDKHREATLAETKRYHDLAIGEQRLGREQRGDTALANAMARMAGGSGGGTRGSSGSRGGADDGGGGQPPLLKPNEILKAYEESRKEAIEAAAAGGDKPPNVDDAAATLLALKTARLQENKRTGQWAIRSAAPSGQYGTVAEFDSEEAAAAALQDLIRRQSVPKQGRLGRDDRRDAAPGDAPGPYATPAMPAIPRPTRAGGGIPSTDEFRAAVVQSEAREGARAKAKESPEYRALAAQRKQAIMANDSKAITAIEAQMNAILTAAK